MKAIINRDFLRLFLYESEIEGNYVEIDEECLIPFNEGDEVEILKELPIGAFAEDQKSYVVFNPRNNESVTLAECFLEFSY